MVYKRNAEKSNVLTTEGVKKAEMRRCLPRKRQEGQSAYTDDRMRETCCTVANSLD